MSKGTPSQGKRNKITHIPCRRCGKPSYHIRKKKCSKCGFPRSKIKKYKWNWKSVLTRKRKK